MYKVKEALENISDSDTTLPKKNTACKKETNLNESHLSDHEKTLKKILNRRRHLSERLTTSRPNTPLENFPFVDTRWLSSEELTHPWHYEEKWWLATISQTILDTKPRVFGHRKIFLIDKKYPHSENNLTIGKS